MYTHLKDDYSQYLNHEVASSAVEWHKGLQRLQGCAVHYSSCDGQSCWRHPTLQLLGLEQQDFHTSTSSFCVASSLRRPDVPQAALIPAQICKMLYLASQ